MNELASVMTAPEQRQGPAPDEVERAIAAATRALLDGQRPDGHFVFELEADVTIPAEYILYHHYLGDPPPAELEEKIGRYLRRRQSDQHDGWPLLHGEEFNISASVKAYFALKMIGDPIDAPHMQRARASHSRAWRRGAEQCLHARAARDLWRRAVARRAGDADRDHASAGVVSLPSVENFLLGAHGSRAAHGGDDA